MKKIYLLLLLVAGFAEAQIVNIPDTNFKVKLLSSGAIPGVAVGSSGNPVAIDANENGQVEVFEALNVYELYIQNSNIADLTGIEAFTNLRRLECDRNSITLLNISALTNMQYINCQLNDIASVVFPSSTVLTQVDIAANNLVGMDVSTLPFLTFLNCSDNALTALDVSACSSMTVLYCSNNQIPDLDVTGLTGLHALHCANNLLASLDVTHNAALAELDCGSNQLTSLDISALANMWLLNCVDNQLTALDFSNNTNLSALGCSGNLFAILDVSPLTALNQLSASPNSQLSVVFMKNGRTQSSIQLAECPNLMYLCVDESEMAAVQNILTQNGLTNAVCNSYCSFTPGGLYNTISGNLTYDSDNNGCDPDDIVATQHLKVNISNATETGSTFTDNAGSFKFYTGSGDHTIAPALETPAYFNVSPVSATVNFPLVNSSVAVRDFCIAPNGQHSDLEIVLIPIRTARPGMDAHYKIVCRNKGTHFLSSPIALIFDGDRCDFVSSNPMVNTQSVNTLGWFVSNLLPFESRVIDFTLHINSPIENPPVNAGDVLNFNAALNYNGVDETPEDNTFQLSQVVVNSMDPNIKTCLEGTNVLPENIGKYLHYNINFENIGTADAINIVVKDTIDTTRFDINSLQLLYASHPLYTKIKGNIVEFIFENINLPPSIMNPIGGHGNVLFKIKTLPTLTIGDEVSNTANIYFDYNAPIDTNEARTAFNNLSKTDFVKDDSVTVYPNPAKNKVTVKAAGTIKTIQLYDLQGRILQSVSDSKSQITLDISNQQRGVYFITITTEKGSAVEKIIKD